MTMKWRNRTETPKQKSPGLARMVLVHIEDVEIGRPSARYGFGHRIVSDNPYSPPDGWYARGAIASSERVLAWAYLPEFE